MEDINSTLMEIKKDFFRYKNGIVADSLKNIYPKETKILGLIAPQFMEIANKYPKNLKLGLSLWNEKNNRESRILALYLLPSDEINPDIAKEMILNIQSNEEAEILAFKILRHLPYAKKLYAEMEDSPLNVPSVLYCIKMFKKNLETLDSFK